MALDKPLVSIIIVNYKTEGLVSSCIETIEKFTHDIPHETIVVDNSANQDNFFSLEKSLQKFGNINLVNPNVNLGFGRANNLGASMSKGDFLLFLNSDTLLTNNAIGAMLKMFSSKKNVGAAGCNFLKKNGKPGTSFWRKKQSLFQIWAENLAIRSFARNHIRNDGFNYSKKPIKIRGFISGACIMIPKGIFETISGFDKDIFMYGEDALICKQIQDQGFDLFNTPEGCIIHLEGGSDSKAFSSAKIQHIVDGSYRYYLKAYGLKKANRYLTLYGLIYFVSYLRKKLSKDNIGAANSLGLSKKFRAKRKESKN